MIGHSHERHGKLRLRRAKPTAIPATFWATVFILFAAGSAASQQRETISFESLQKGRPVLVTAEIYWPAKAGPVPAMVIHHGSGGLNDWREGRTAREMAGMGVAGVVIDSFKPRGISATIQDQMSVTAPDFNLDALRILTALGNNGRIDRSKIGIMGFSKGGTSTLVAAHEHLVVAAGVPTGLRYALHVPFYPACVTQYLPKTTGAPIYMLLGGSDTYAGVEPCVTNAEALRAAGARIEVKIYPNAPHGFDSNGRPWFDPRGENNSQCVFQQQADRSWIERKSGVKISSADAKDAPILAPSAKDAFRVCQTLGVTAGPNDAARAQSAEDLKAYVRRHLLGG